MVFPKKSSDWDYPGRGRGSRRDVSAAAVGAATDRWVARSASGGAARIDPLSGDKRTEDPSALAERVVFRLWADGHVNARAIEQARREVDSHLRLDQALIRLHLVDGAVVAGALAEELDLPLVQPEELPEEPIAHELLPARFVSEALALPLSDDGRIMRLAMADPLDDYTLRAIAMKTKRRIEICVGARGELETLIAKLYRGMRSAEPAPAERPRANAHNAARRGEPTGAGRRGDARFERDQRQDSPATPRFVRPRRVTLKDRLHEHSPSPRRRMGDVALSGAPLERRSAAERKLNDAPTRNSDANWRRLSARNEPDDAPNSPFRTVTADLSAAEDRAAGRRRFVTGFVSGFMSGGADVDDERAGRPAPASRSAAASGALTRGLSDIDAPIDVGDPLDRHDADSDRGERPRRDTRFLPSPEKMELDTREIDRTALISARNRAQNSAARRLAMTRLRQTIRGETIDADEFDRSPRGDEPAEGPNRIYQAARAVEARGTERGALVRHTLISHPSEEPRRSRFTPRNEAVDAEVESRPPTRAFRRREPAGDAGSFDSLSFSDATQRSLDAAIEGGEGLILICGPSGANKKATMDALAAKATAKGATLRRFDEEMDAETKQNADASVFTGEIRDAGSAEAAARAAMMGGLVLASMDAPSAAAAPPRLVEMGLPPYVLASSLRAVVAQHIAPRICQSCHGRRSTDCPECDGEGRSGSVAIAETLTLDDTIRALILAQAPTAAFRHAMRAANAPSLADDAAEKISAGLVLEGDAASAASAASSA